MMGCFQNRMPSGHKQLVQISWFWFFTFFWHKLNFEVPENSTNSDKINAEISQWTVEDANDQNDTSSKTINDTVRATTANEMTSRFWDTNFVDSDAVTGPECTIHRGLFRRKIHLQTGRSYFSSSDCALEVCNEKGDLDFYSCNRLDAWDVLRPAIDREVNEGQLQCLKAGCI